MSYSYDFNSLIPTKYRIVPIDADNITADVEFQDGGKSFNEMAETYARRWEFIYEGLTPAEANAIEAKFNTYRYSTSFTFTDKAGIAHTNCYFEKGTYQSDHNGHRAWRQRRAFVIIKYNADAPDVESPTTPTGFSATPAGATTVNLSWSASTDNVAVTGYEYRIDGGSAVDAGAGTTEAVTGLTAATEYDFEVRAYDAAGNKSDWSTVATATTASNPILDEITSTVTCAYSLRKLRDAYAGAAIRVKRSSDSTEQDIGFDSNGDLDTADSFLDGSTYYVTKWYNQGSAGTPANKDLVAFGSDAATDPKLDTAANGGKGAVVFNANRAGLEWSVDTETVQYFCTCLITKVTTEATNDYFWAYNGNILLRNLDNSGIKITMSNGLAVYYANIGTAIRQITTVSQSGNDSIYQDGTEIGTAGQIGDTSRTSMQLHIGKSFSGTSFDALDGEINEFIMIDGAFSSGDQTEIESNQKSYWGIS